MISNVRSVALVFCCLAIFGCAGSSQIGVSGPPLLGGNDEGNTLEVRYLSGDSNLIRKNFEPSTSAAIAYHGDPHITFSTRQTVDGVDRVLTGNMTFGGQGIWMENPPAGMFLKFQEGGTGRVWRANSGQVANYYDWDSTTYVTINVGMVPDSGDAKGTFNLNGYLTLSTKGHG